MVESVGAVCGCVIHTQSPHTSPSLPRRSSRSHAIYTITVEQRRQQVGDWGGKRGGKAGRREAGQLALEGAGRDAAKSGRPEGPGRCRGDEDA